MATCAATGITSDTNNDAWINIFSFTNYDGGQMAIADRVIAMPQCNIVARTKTFVLVLQKGTDVWLMLSVQKKEPN